MAKHCHHSVLMAFFLPTIPCSSPDGIVPVYPVLLWTYSYFYIFIIYILTVTINN